MATVLDVGLLEYFLPAFIFFLVLIFVWAILEKVNFFTVCHIYLFKFDQTENTNPSDKLETTLLG